MNKRSIDTKKILIVSSSLQIGGIESASSSLANYFSEENFDVYFFCIFKHSQFFHLNKEITLIEPNSAKFQRLNIFTAPIRIRKAVLKIKPDTVLVFNKFYGAITLLGLWGLSTPVYISERASPYYKFPKAIEYFINWIYKLFRPAGIIAQTSFAAEIQKKYYKKGIPIKVIPNILRDIQPENQKRENTILAVGRLNDPLKGFDRLVEAFTFINNTDWKLLFVGNNAKSSGLKELIIALGLEDRVEFKEQVQNINQIYAEAGIFVITSRSEGFPNALIEAMAFGLPCISYDFVAGPSEIIENGVNGILIEDGNSQKLAQAIDYLIDNPDIRNKYGEAAKSIRYRLGKNILVPEYLNFILK